MNNRPIKEKTAEDIVRFLLFISNETILYFKRAIECNDLIHSANVAFFLCLATLFLNLFSLTVFIQSGNSLFSRFQPYL